MNLVIAFALIMIGSAVLGYSIGKLARLYINNHPPKEQWNEDKL